MDSRHSKDYTLRKVLAKVVSNDAWVNSADFQSNNNLYLGPDQYSYAYATHCVWDPGETLRIPTLVALNVTNQQQQLLPGYEVKVGFMDSRRDKASFPCRTG